MRGPSFDGYEIPWSSLETPDDCKTQLRRVIGFTHSQSNRPHFK
jgi:hypothetical protein